MRPSMIFVAGIAAGIAFIIACGNMNAGTDASASPTDCATWQVQYVQVPVGSGASFGTLPAGWEPFSVVGSGSGDFNGWARRCAP